MRMSTLALGIDRLNDLPRSGRPLKLGAEKIKEILTLTTHRVSKQRPGWKSMLASSCTLSNLWMARKHLLGMGELRA